MDAASRINHELILVEQIRLLLGNVGSSVLPAYFLAALMAFGLGHAETQQALNLWCFLVITSKTVCALHARYFLKGRLRADNAMEVYVEIMVLNIMDAIAWSSLALITLNSAEMVEFMLVNSVLAGIAGSSMSLLSPLLPVFVTFIGIEFSIVAFKFWQLGDASYQLLSLALVLYFASLSLQAKNSCLAAKNAIKLRFENTELLSLLRDETIKANAAHQEAVEANLAKSKFLAAASHDLRQPIHALGLFLGVLGSSKLSEQQQLMLESAQSVNTASSEMLDTLLDFSRIEAGVIEVQVEAFRLQSLLNKIENEFAPQANDKGLIYRSRETTAVLNSDASLVELILRNLVSNAIRYTDNGGLFIGTRKRGDTTCIEVWDTGIGIPQSQHQEIFQEFHQLGNSERDRRKGLGLGLAICDGLARTLGHHLSLASRPGRGSVFRLTIPNAVGAEPAQVEPVHTLGEIQSHSFHVLVLDDDESVRSGMSQLLQTLGCQCAAVETIEEALAYVSRHQPDIFVSDYRLRSQGTGVDAICQIRAKAGHEIAAILITGDTAPERLRDAHASGVQLLHKPVDPQSLYEAIAREIQRTQRGDSLLTH